MKVYDATSIRNVAIVGHTGSGKTQLVSAILSDAGMINRFGKVDDGTTITDYDEEEISRKHTLSAGLAYAEWNRTKINFIDTPGIANFLADARAALRVADALEAGMIWLNSENVRHLPTPFGGMKSSGIGRDGGDYSFDFYMETKHVSLARGTHKIQRLGV